MMRFQFSTLCTELMAPNANFSRVPKARRVEGRSPGTNWKFLLCFGLLNVAINKHEN